MKFFLIVSLLIINLFAETLESPVQRLYLSLNGKDSIILLDKKSEKYLKDIDAKVFYSFRKIEDKWLAQVKTKEGKWGFMDSKAHWVVKPTLDKAKAFSKDNITRVQKDGKWFFLKSDGTILFQKKYNYVTPFRDGLAAVQEESGGLYGYINLSGKKVFKKSFNIARAFAKNGLAAVAIAPDTIKIFDVTPKQVVESKRAGQVIWGYMNRKGEMVIPPKFSRVGTFNDFNITEITDDAGNSMLIDAKGNFITNTKYEYLWGFSRSGVAWSESIGEDKFTGYIDTKGKPVWKASYHNFSGEWNGLLVNERNGFQVFDPYGKLIIKEKSTWLQAFQDENVSVALRAGKWGILSRNGQFNAFSKNIIAPLTSTNNNVYGFTDGLLPMINKKKEIVYFDRGGVAKYYFKSNEKNKMALYNSDNKIVFQSDIDKRSAYPFLSRGVEEHFTDKSDYGDGLYDTINKLLNEKSKKYHIPNLVYSDSDNPYEFDKDEEEIKKGVIKVIAKGYVGEEEWGSYYFLENEYQKFSAYETFLEKIITKKYGKPLSKEYDRISWKIGGKILTLEAFSDTGDGDFYNMIILAIEEK